MVEYSDWVSIVWEQVPDDWDGEATAVIEVAASIWGDRKGELQSSSKTEANRIAESEVSVSR